LEISLVSGILVSASASINVPEPQPVIDLQIWMGLCCHHCWCPSGIYLVYHPHHFLAVGP
jgi:hypothetical protein